MAYVQCIAPPDVKAHGVEGLLIAHIVPLLQKAQTQETGYAEIRPPCRAVQHRIAILISKENGKDFASEEEWISLRTTNIMESRWRNNKIGKVRPNLPLYTKFTQLS